MKNKFFILFSVFAIFSFFMIAGPSVHAQEDGSADNAAVDDLGVDQQRLLPNNPLYFLKEWARGIELFFTFDKLDKIEKRFEFANENLAEALQLAQENGDENAQNAIQDALERRAERLDQLSQDFGELSDDEKNDERIQNLLDNLILKEDKAQNLIDRLSDKIPEDALQKLSENKDRMVAHLRDVIESSGQSDEQIRERLKNIFTQDEERDGEDEDNEVRMLHRAEFLERLGDNDLKDAVKEVRDRVLDDVENRLENADEDALQRFKDALENADSDEIRLRLLQRLEEGPNRIRRELRTDIRTKIDEAEERRKLEEEKQENEDHEDEDESHDEDDSGREND